jgi:hypothetical protein
MPQFFEFWAGTLLPLVGKTEKAVRIGYSPAAVSSNDPSMHWLLVQESMRQSQSGNR